MAYINLDYLTCSLPNFNVLLVLERSAACIYVKKNAVEPMDKRTLLKTGRLTIVIEVLAFR